MKMKAKRQSEKAKKKYERRKRPIEEKESYKWIKALENARRGISKKTQIVHVGDRESDIYEFFMKAEELNEKYLVRSAQERTISEDDRRLWDYMKNRKIAGYTKIKIPQNSKRIARTARLSIRFERVELNPPQNFWMTQNKNARNHITYAIYLNEINPPEAVEPIEWKLLTNVEVDNLEDALERIAWYRRRWDIEEFHKILKSGCSIEDCRLETVERLSNFIALKSVIAWRIFWITKINRTNPNDSCLTVLAEHEWKSLYIKIHKVSFGEVPKKPPSVREVVRWIGQLGGFLGRKGDKEPGITVIWRGWQRLNDISEFLIYLRER